MTRMENRHIPPDEIDLPGIPERRRHPILDVMVVGLVIALGAILLRWALLPPTPDAAASEICVMHPRTDYMLLRWMLDGARVLGPWSAGGSVTAPDGHVYAYVESIFLQGQTLVIGRDAGDGWLYHSYQIVGETNQDPPRLWIPLVRPAGAKDEYGQLYCSDSGVVIGIPFENHCFMAYDVHAQQFFGHPSSNRPGEEITKISPFVLIGPDTQLHQPDVIRIQDAARNRRSNSERVLSTDALRQALDHPNPEVRSLAARLLDLMGEGEGKKTE